MHSLKQDKAASYWTYFWVFLLLTTSGTLYLAPGKVRTLAAQPRSSCFSLEGCVQAIQRGAWMPLNQTKCSELAEPYGICSEELQTYWKWDALVPGCSQRHFSREEMWRLWADRSILFSGDSHCRYLNNAMSKLFGGEELNKTAAHAMGMHGSLAQVNNATHTRWDYRIAYYVRDQAASWWMGNVGDEKKEPFPDVLVASGTAWSLIMEKNMSRYVLNTLDFAEGARAYKQEADKAGKQTLFLWLNLGPRHNKYKPLLTKNVDTNPILLTEVWNTVPELYGVTVPGGPFHLLDAYHIIKGCLGNDWCHQPDGVHTGDLPNELMLQLMVNMWLTLTRQGA